MGQFVERARHALPTQRRVDYDRAALAREIVHELPTTPDAGSLVTQLAQQVAGQTAGIEFSAYVADLVGNAKVRLNEKVFE